MKPPTKAPRTWPCYAAVAAGVNKVCGGDAALVIIFHAHKGAAVTLACEDAKIREKIPEMLRRIALEMDSETGIEFKLVGSVPK